MANQLPERFPNTQRPSSDGAFGVGPVRQQTLASPPKVSNWSWGRKVTVGLIVIGVLLMLVGALAMTALQRGDLFNHKLDFFSDLKLAGPIVFMGVGAILATVFSIYFHLSKPKLEPQPQTPIRGTRESDAVLDNSYQQKED